MLVISQKAGDQILLSSGITISVLEVKAGKVRLGIQAPEQVKIERKASALKSDKKAKLQNLQG